MFQICQLAYGRDIEVIPMHIFQRLTSLCTIIDILTYCHNSKQLGTKSKILYYSYASILRLQLCKLGELVFLIWCLMLRNLIWEKIFLF